MPLPLPRPRATLPGCNGHRPGHRQPRRRSPAPSRTEMSTSSSSPIPRLTCMRARATPTPWPRPSAPRGLLAADPAETDLVAIRVAVGDLADAVAVSLLFGGRDAPLRYCRDALIEIADEDSHYRVASFLGSCVDVDRPILGELPDGLGVMGDEARLGA